MSKPSEAEREAALASAREVLPIGTTVYLIARHVSASGMSRVVEAFVIRNGRPWLIRRHLVDVLGLKSHKRYDGVTVHGAGMDMGFWVVNSLSNRLYGNGDSLKREWL